MEDKFSERLTYLREKRGWTKSYVAKKLGIKTVSTYANYEYGLREPDQQMLIKMADLFEVSVDYLLRGRDYRQEAQEILDDPNTNLAARDGNPDAEETLKVIEKILRERGE